MSHYHRTQSSNYHSNNSKLNFLLLITKVYKMAEEIFSRDWSCVSLTSIYCTWRWLQTKSHIKEIRSAKFHAKYQLNRMIVSIKRYFYLKWYSTHYFVSKLLVEENVENESKGLTEEIGYWKIRSKKKNSRLGIFGACRRLSTRDFQTWDWQSLLSLVNKRNSDYKLRLHLQLHTSTTENLTINNRCKSW